MSRFARSLGVWDFLWKRVRSGKSDHLVGPGGCSVQSTNPAGREKEMTPPSAQNHRCCHSPRLSYSSLACSCLRLRRFATQSPQPGRAKPGAALIASPLPPVEPLCPRSPFLLPCRAGLGAKDNYRTTYSQPAARAAVTRQLRGWKAEQPIRGRGAEWDNQLH